MRSDGSHYEKRGKGEPVCIDDEIPFETPKSWEWCRFETVITIASNLVNPDGYQDLPHIAPDNIEKGTGNLLQYRTVGEDKVKSSNHLFHEGQILYSKIRPALRKAVLAPCDGLCSADMYPLSSPLDSAYLLALLLSDYFTSQTLKDDTRVKMPKTNQAALNAILVPVPPLAEQIRIGKHLSTITPLIDQYGALENSRERLDAELPDRLRKSVLQLAVQGKLVDQDPADEPASALLERIRTERATLVKAGKIKAPKGGESVIYRASDGGYYEKRGKGEPVCIDDEIPFEIPESWEWVRLGTVVSIVSARRVHQSDWQTRGVPFYRAREIVKLAQSAPIDDALFISESLYETLSANGVPQAGDLMVTGVGTIGTSYIVQESDRFYYKDASVLCFENRMGMHAEFLQLLMQSDFMLNQIRTASSGTTVATITMKNAVDFFVPIPPIKEQKRIVERCDELTHALG